MCSPGNARGSPIIGQKLDFSMFWELTSSLFFCANIFALWRDHYLNMLYRLLR